MTECAVRCGSSNCGTDTTVCNGLTPHHLTSPHITSHYITSHHITSHHITSHHGTNLQPTRALTSVAPIPHAPSTDFSCQTALFSVRVRSVELFKDMLIHHNMQNASATLESAIRMARTRCTVTSCISTARLATYRPASLICALQ